MPSVPIWMGEASGGRSPISPTFSRSRSRRTRMDLQNGQVVCTADDQRKVTGAPQLGQFAALLLIRALHQSHAHLARRKTGSKGSGEIPIGPRPAAEQVQAQRA